MPFALDANPSQSELSDAVNYLLSNFNVGTVTNESTGQITVNDVVIGYLYQYISVKYATSFDGTVGFSDVPTNASYFGIRNTNDTVESTNPADYIWQEATGGFGTTKFLWYGTIGGRQIKFYIGVLPPDAYWLKDSGSAIDLDLVFNSLIAKVYIPIDIVPADSAGVVTTLPSGNSLSLYNGNSIVTTGVTYSGTITQNGLTLTINSTTGAITLTQSSWSSNVEYFTITATLVGMAFSAIYTIAKAKAGGTGPTGPTGPTGADGTKSITLLAFQWSNSGVPAHTQAFTFTWATGNVSAYPSGWTSSASTSPGTGYTLYMISLTITDIATATTTATNWSAALNGSIGYREDGTIGVQGDGARMAYCKSTIASPAGTTTSTGSTSLPATGSFGLTGSVFYTAPPTLATGEYLYQTDGIYVVSTNTITWQTPYLSNLKVGSLSAISANMGVVSIANPGSIYTYGRSYGSTTVAGFFLGYDSTAYKFDIGNSTGTNYLRFDGSSLSLMGSFLRLNGADTSSTVSTSAWINEDRTADIGARWWTRTRRA